MTSAGSGEALRQQLEAAIRDEQAAFYVVAPSDVSESSSDIADAIWPLVSAALAAQAEEIAALLRRVAEGRKEYAGAPGDPYHDELLKEAQTFENAAKVAEEGEEACYGLLPSWRWSDAMDRKLFSRGSVPAPKGDQ